MYYMETDHLGSRNREPESIVVLKARDTKNTKEILLACLCEAWGDDFVGKLRKEFIKTISDLKSQSTKRTVRTMQKMLEQQFMEYKILEPSVQNSFPHICGIICVDHTFLRFQNHGVIYFLNTKWGKNCVGYKCIPDSGVDSVTMETGTFQEDVGIVLARLNANDLDEQVTKEEEHFLKSLQADCVQNPMQMEKRLKETIENDPMGEQGMEPVIWIVPKEGESVRDDEMAGIL